MKGIIKLDISKNWGIFDMAMQNYPDLYDSAMDENDGNMEGDDESFYSIFCRKYEEMTGNEFVITSQDLNKM